MPITKDVAEQAIAKIEAHNENGEHDALIDALKQDKVPAKSAKTAAKVLRDVGATRIAGQDDELVIALAAA